MAKKFNLHHTAFFGDAEHRFCLHHLGNGDALALIRELQEKTGVGPQRLFNNCYHGGWVADHIREVIRLGLMGGGKTPSEAHRLVGLYFDLNPVADHVPLALDILTACLFGVDPDAPKDLAPDLGDGIPLVAVPA